MTKYTIDKNPPPVPSVSGISGKPKGNLRIALEKMQPGDGLFVPGKKATAVSGPLFALKKLTGHHYVTRSQGDGCYVWCFAAPVQS